jgi:hypothetical protein
MFGKSNVKILQRLDYFGNIWLGTDASQKITVGFG